MVHHGEGQCEGGGQLVAKDALAFFLRPVGGSGKDYVALPQEHGLLGHKRRVNAEEGQGLGVLPFPAGDGVAVLQLEERHHVGDVVLRADGELQLAHHLAAVGRDVQGDDGLAAVHGCAQHRAAGILGVGPFQLVVGVGSALLGQPGADILVLVQGHSQGAGCHAGGVGAVFRVGGDGSEGGPVGDVRINHIRHRAV